MLLIGGEIIPGRSYNASTEDEKYKFTEKERDIETDYDYFGARYYNSKLGLWNSVDPLADKYPGWSPYNYTLNNPINNFDPDGKAVFSGTAVAGSALYVGGAILIAATGHAYNMAINPSYRRSAQSFSQVISSSASQAVEDVTDFVGSLFSSGEATTEENTNPWVGPVDSDVNVVDTDGNVIPVKAGEQIQGNEDGSMVQVKDKDGKPTGTRKDGKGHPKQKDPKAQKQHGHRVDENGNPVLDKTGNSHLPING